MSFRTRGPGPPSCPGGPRGLSGGLRGAGRRHQRIGAIGDLLTPLWTTLCALLLLAATAAGEGNKKYQMESLCGDSFRQLQLRKIDGAELRSQNERNLNCIVTFQTHSILQSFMLRFEELHLDCNDHLYIYDGAHDAGTAKWDLSCRDTRELVGPIHTRTNHVTLKYVTDNWGTERCGFNLIITAVKDPQATCNDFKCKTREFCIHTDLLCDGVNHCADGSDETVSEKCGRGDIGQVLGMSITFLVVATVSALLILGAAVVAIGVCMYRQSPSANTVRASQQPMLGTTNPFQPVVVHSGLNGAGHAMHEPGTTTLSRGPRGPMNPPHTLSLMQPGNWLCPVGTQLGYSTVPARLYCCLVN